MFFLCSRVREVSITTKQTDFEPHHPGTDDAKASLRAALTTQLAAGQAALEAALAQVANADPAIRERVRSQLGMIASLRQQVGTASESSLITMRAEVAALADNASAVAQDARTAASDLSWGSAVAMLAQTARNETNRVMAGMKDFDRDLKFSPGDSEADYRKREAERESYIAAQQAKHTPEGDLNAGGAAMGQMVDAKVHGAGGSEFDKRWHALVATNERLREAAKANGISTEEFDDHLRDDLRRIMKSKGMTDAQIDARFAASNNDPMEAAKTIVKSNDDIASLQRSAERVATMERPANNTAQDDMKSAIASLQGAGVVTIPHDPAAAPDHGVAMAQGASPQRSV